MVKNEILELFCQKRMNHDKTLPTNLYYSLRRLKRIFETVNNTVYVQV